MNVSLEYLAQQELWQLAKGIKISNNFETAFFKKKIFLKFIFPKFITFFNINLET